ncbi:hypothetical protein GQ53DRAFT_751458 [Thozetella sp. PMI_491]|nr:hypothetical protein GQ53DRAFT_751458 [Thozetella sp. PMI_491]
MPPRPAFLDLNRTSYICQSCLASLQPARAHLPRLRQPWPPLRYSSVARRRPGSRHVPSDRESLVPRPQIDTDQPDQPLSVRYFDEEQPGDLKPLKDNEEFNRLSGGLDDEIQYSIEELELQMENTLRILDLMEQKGMKEKADKLRKQYGSKLQDQGSETAAEPAVDDETPLPQLPYLDLNTKTQKERVNGLNRFLRFHQANGGEISPKLVSYFWKLYVPTRQTLALSWSRVPPEAWTIFWAVGSWDKGDNPNRMHHIYTLTQDMQAAGVALSDSQQLLAIEATFIEGLERGAIELWKKAAGTLGANPGTFKEYWELGIRMCSLQGDIERAFRAANTLLESAHESDPRILVPLIRALAQGEPTREQAWESYRRLRELLGDSMAIEDYDEVIACFLSTNCVELALQAFVDMMFSGAIDLHGKTKLPAQVANRFFLGKWLKRLIGAGDLDGAYKVVCFMAERGVLAAPIQLNGLLGAWMRSRTADNAEKAEKLGWAMVRSRLLFVDLRKRQQALSQWPIQLVPVGKLPGCETADGEEPGLSYVPPATLETFSLMADNYQKRRLTNRMEELWVAFKQSEIGSDSFMMNQMLESFCQDGESAKVFDFYHTMTRDHNILPDAATFLTLFRSLNVNRLQRRDKAGSQQDVLQARKIFQDMISLPWGFSSAQTYEQLPRLILFSLYSLRDYAGMIVAVRAMKELFDFAPSETLLIDLAAGTTSLRKGRRPGQKAVAQLIQVGKYVGSLLEQHLPEGQSPQTLTPQQKVAQLNSVLEMLILRKAEADAAGEEVEEVIAVAAEKMGAYDIVVARDLEMIAQARKSIDIDR